MPFWVLMVMVCISFKESPETHIKTDTFIKKLLANVVTYDNGARAATTSFTQRGLGDVLITTENEAHLARQAICQRTSRYRLSELFYC